MLFLFIFEEIMTQAWWFNSHDFIMHATDLNFRSQRGPQFSQSWRKVLEEKDCNCGLDVTVSWSDLGQITSECGYLLQRKGCSVGECREVLWRCVCEGVQVLWSYVSKRLHVCEWANERRRKRERERERSKVQKNNNSKLTFRFELYISLWEKISEQHFWRHWGRIGRF